MTQHEHPKCITKYRAYLFAIFLCLLYLITKIYNTFTPIEIQPVKSVPVIGDKIIDNNRRVLINPEISCHYSTLYDALPSVKNLTVLPGDRPIFFHDTSCHGGITNREACIIEAAARLHPKRQINLLFSSPVSEFRLNTSNLVHLLKIKNIKLFRLLIDQYAEGTVVDSIFRNRIKKSAYPVEHVSDILRIVTLNKYGGVYLDTDSFVIKNLDSLPRNWIAKESNVTLMSGAMEFSVDGLGHNLTSAILQELHDTYNPISWYQNGPQAIQRVLNRMCLKVDLEKGDCKGLKIFPPKDFYPVHYSYSWQYFKNRYLDTMNKSYMHHMWNSMTRKMKIDRFSPYAFLAYKYCPSIFGTYSKEFGQ